MLYAVKNKDGEIQVHTVSSSVVSAWRNAMFVGWMTTGKIDTNDIKGSVARFVKEAKSEGRSVVPVEVREVGRGVKDNTQ